MGDSSKSKVDRRALGVLFNEGAIGPRSDADLLRMVATREKEIAEAAFATLIDRHGPMVLGVCRRILRNEHAAEDAFQAVFLVLARKAASVRAEDSLGRWLFGVARKVASRARRLAARQAPTISSTDRTPDNPASVVIREEIQRIVDREVALLPRKYREAAALCHLDGLSHEQAAEALGVPVGTIRSRLSRARDILRPRLIRRGLAPTAVAAWIGSPTASAAVPRGLMESTLAFAGPSTAVIPPAILALAAIEQASIALRKVAVLLTGTLISGGLTVGLMALATSQGPSNGPAISQVPASEAEKAKAPSLADEIQRLIREWLSNMDQRREMLKGLSREMLKGLSKEEAKQRLQQAGQPEAVAAFADRLINLVAAHPGDPGGRDGLLWVVNHRNSASVGDFGQAFNRAAYLLVRDYANDPEVARSGLDMYQAVARPRDVFMEGVYAVAENREARGLIRFGMARYLHAKAEHAEYLRTHPEPRRSGLAHNFDAQGTSTALNFDLTPERRGYDVHLRMLEPAALRGESERLLGEVAAEYGDIPYVTSWHRELERQLRERPAITINGRLEEKGIQAIERRLARPVPTLGEKAADLLDDWRNLSIGKLAPDVSGVDMDGRPINLSDHRGRVVALAFWDPNAVRGIPDLVKLAEKMKGRPFDVLGVCDDENVEEAKKVAQVQSMNWPNIVGEGRKIAERFHIEDSLIRLFIIDQEGIIRGRSIYATGVNPKLLEDLVAEAEAKAKD
ncbi:sigma-70 family RNA polymerase sigma factor [Paludisphaera rhizosphaerae]|uniref:sigma-70 family RNA polymerase sigma factor n=1 Tax=Paludisphaera rhizosphaerae TaxID=2711216 RepID=UPI0013ED7CD2|nr:sigma-70 family RNA polymerase sigma factor [Paludisphaera rhizosphaerae]